MHDPDLVMCAPDLVMCGPDLVMCGPDLGPGLKQYINEGGTPWRILVGPALNNSSSLSTNGRCSPICIKPRRRIGGVCYYPFY